MSEACSTRGQNIDSYKIWVWRPEGNILLGRPRFRWEDNIEMDLKLIGFDV
jgi:hypothetical protein